MNGRRGARHIIAVGGERYAEVSSDAFLLTKIISGERSVPEVAADLSKAHGRSFTTTDVERAVVQLQRGLAGSRGRSASMRLIAVPLVPERVVNAIADRLRFLYHPAVATAALCAAAVAVADSLAGHLVYARGAGDSWSWGVAYAIFLLGILIHEFGHATASKAHGVRPRCIGLTVFFIMPALYSDVSRSWLLPRKGRLVVDFGGAYFQLLALGGFAACALLTHSALWSRVELMTLGSIFFNLNPVLRFDGYWALADAIGVPNLSPIAARTLGAVFRLAAPPRMHLSAARRLSLMGYAVFEITAYAYLLVSTVMLLRASGIHNLIGAGRHIYAGQVSLSDLMTVGFTLLSLFVVASAIDRLARHLLVKLAAAGSKSSDGTADQPAPLHA